jgi:hypothetical protein
MRARYQVLECPRHQPRDQPAVAVPRFDHEVIGVERRELPGCPARPCAPARTEEAAHPDDPCVVPRQVDQRCIEVGIALVLPFEVGAIERDAGTPQVAAHDVVDRVPFLGEVERRDVDLVSDFLLDQQCQLEQAQ